MRKIKVFFFLFIIILFITGCELENLKVNNPLTEEEIVKFAEKEIHNLANDEVEVKIISKEQQYGCAVSLFDASCIYKQEKEGVYEYKLEILNKENNEIKATGTYIDGYIEYDSKHTSIIAHEFKNNYLEQKSLYLIKEEFTNILKENFEESYLYKDISNPLGYDIFLHSNDYEQLNNLINELNNIINKYNEHVKTTLSVYIYKDEEVYKNTDFSKYLVINNSFGGQSYGKDVLEELTKKEVTKIGDSKGFPQELFESNGSSAATSSLEYIDYHSFDYLVFWSKIEPGTIEKNSTMQIFGIR